MLPKMVLSKADILSGPKPRTETVDVPELGGMVLVRGMRASDVIEFAMMKEGNYGDVPMLVYCVVNEDGSQMFTLGDLPALMQSPMSVLKPMLEKAKDLSGLGDLPKSSGAST